MTKVSIVILHFQSVKNTLECLSSIEKQSSNNFERSVIVVDNGTEPQFRIKNEELGIRKVKIIRNEENLGFAGGNNVGIKTALDDGADYVIVLNNDTIADKNLIDELLNVAKSDKKVGIVVPKIYFAKGYEFHKDRYKKEELGKVIWYGGGIIDWDNVIAHHRGVDEVDSGQYDSVVETEYATGCCMMVKRELIEQIGIFNERYYLYYEDSDLSLRTKKAGFRIIFAPKALLWHKNASASGGSGSELQDYYTTRNRLLFGTRYAPIRSKISLIRESLKLLLLGRPWQKKGVLDFYFSRFGKGSYQV